jgi:hypothetical protein
MTCEIFQKFLVSLDRRMASKSRNILLFVDHCPAHPEDVRNFKNVQVEFFPANTTLLCSVPDLESLTGMSVSRSGQLYPYKSSYQ